MIPFTTFSELAIGDKFYTSLSSDIKHVWIKKYPTRAVMNITEFSSGFRPNEVVVPIEDYKAHALNLKREPIISTQSQSSNKSPDDIFEWPSGEWCFRSDAYEMNHLSDDYKVHLTGSKTWKYILEFELSGGA